MSWREFQMKKGKRIQIWRIRQVGEKFETEHGLQGGAMQGFFDIPGSKGKEGTKSFVSAEDNTSFHIEREVRKKIEHGYIEYVDGVPLTEQVTEVVFSKALPKNFCSYKPQTDIKPDALLKMHLAGKARYTRKMDGMATLAVHHPTGWEFYTRRMDLTTDRFPNHVIALSNSDFPIGTILIGEAVCLRNGKEDFKAISSFYRSLPEESRQIVDTNAVPEPVFVIFDILFYNSNSLANMSYDDRSSLYRHKFKSMAENTTLIACVDLYNITPETWEKFAKDRGWEGFVVTDGTAIPGEKFFSFDGSAQRPKGHHKLKPCYSDEVIVYATGKGTGKRLNGIGALFVKQIHPETGFPFSCGKVGSGMTDSDLEDLENLRVKYGIPLLDKDKEADVLDLTINDSQLVVEIEYGERQPGTNKFRFPVFMRVRTDKKPSECIAQRLAPEEE